MPVPVTNSKRIRLFRNDHLERMTLISPRVFALSWFIILPLIAWSGWGTATPWVATGLAAAGLLVWTVFEYAMHRYLFHWESDIRLARWLVYLIHGNHHESPNDPLRGLMPLGVSIPVCGLLWLAFVGLMGPAGSWLLLGFMTGYVAYDVIHYACHQWPMRSPLGMHFKRHHMRHHYVDEHANYSISAIFLDRIFGTHIKSLKRDEENAAAPGANQ
jgi:sterol desaturase/sphingolipid hydroxylase (fatty acid hydroxylase superfamily)